MNQREQLRRMFVLLHIVLGATLFVGSAITACNGGHGEAYSRRPGLASAS